jgi:tetratricopeptide (TPR) repeat protein
MNAARAALDGGRYQEAERIYAAAIAECHGACAAGPELGRAIFQLGLAKMGEARYFEAADLFQRSIGALAEKPGVAAAEFANIWTAMGSAYYYERLYARSEKAYAAALEIRERRIPADRGAMAEILSNLGMVYVQQDRCDEARNTIEKARTLAESDAAISDVSRASLLNNSGTLHRSCGPTEGAEQEFQAALRVLRRSRDHAEMLTATVANNFALELMHRNDFDGAACLFERVLRVMEMPMPLPSTYAVRMLQNYAFCLRKQGKSKEARRVESRAEMIIAAMPLRERSVIDASEMRFESTRVKRK